MNNREIKFRAWDKEKKRFIFIRLIAGGLVFYTNDFGTLLPDITEFCKTLGRWEQYTSLKDQNGKEIYERDIIEVKNPSTNNVLDHFQVSLDPQKDCLNNWDVWQVNVIGNIYENPELLEKGGGND